MYIILRKPTDNNPAGYYSYNNKHQTEDEAKRFLNLLFENFKQTHKVKYINQDKTEFINESNHTTTYIKQINPASDNIKTYTSKNQFNCSIKQIIINYSAQTYEVRHGSECRIEKTNSTTKAINEKINELRAAGFICLNGGGNE